MKSLFNYLRAIAEHSTKQIANPQSQMNDSNSRGMSNTRRKPRLIHASIKKITVLLSLFTAGQILLFLEAPKALAAPKTWACDGYLYQGINDPTEILKVNTGTNALDSQFMLSVYVNALGFNVKDGYVYGSSSDATIYRVGSDGQFQSLGKSASIPSSFVGDVDANGIYHIYSSGKIYKVDVSGTTANLLSTVTVSSSPNIQDFAFNPFDHLLYSSDNGNIIAINPSTGAVTNFTTTNPSGNAANGAVYFDAFGSLYVYNNSAGKLWKYQLDLSAKTAIGSLFATGPGSLAKNDGFSCPYQVRLQKTVNSGKTSADGTATTSAGSNVTYTYLLSNPNATPVSGITLSDTMPDGRTFVSGTLNNSLGGTANSYGGTNTLSITGITLPAQSITKITAQAQVPVSTAVGRIYNQAQLNNIPTAFGGPQQFSDYPPTGLYGDQTPLDVTAAVVGSITGKVFDDANNNGVVDTGETGFSTPVTVTLKNSSGNAVATTTTAADGTYTFNNVLVGTGYTVVVTPPSGTTETLDPDTTKDNQTSGVNVTAGVVDTLSSFAYAVASQGTPAYCSIIYATDSITPSNIYTVNTSTGAYTNIGTAGFFSAAAAVQPSTGKLFYFSRDTTGGPQQTGIWDPTTKSNTTLPQTFSTGSGYPIRAAFSADGRLFAATNTSVLYEVNPTTGAAISSNQITLSDGVTALPGGNGDMAFDGDGVLFFFSNQDLYSIDTSTNKAYLVASGPSGTTFNSLAFTPNGGLYGYSSSNNTVYSINTNTGTVTAVGSPTLPTGAVGTDYASCAAPVSNVQPTKTAAKFSGSTGSNVQPGDVIEYTIIIPNSGNVPATNAIFKDPIPAGTTYVAGSTTTNGTNVADGSGGTFPFASGASIHSPALKSGIIGTGSTYDISLKYRVQVNTTNPPASVSNQGTVVYLGGSPGGITTNPSITTITQPVANKPNVLLVKRFTALNGGITTQGGDNFGAYIDDPNNSYDDNNVHNPAPNPPSTQYWPNPTTFLIGGINGGKVQPGDELEYTIYFLSTGQAPAKNVLLCDRVPDNVTFVPTAFNSVSQDPSGIPNSDRGIELSFGGNTVSFTNAGDGDRGQFFPAGVDPKTVYPNVNCGGSNTNGAVVVNLGDVPNATASGQPSNSYGFFRFRGQVK